MSQNSYTGSALVLTWTYGTGTYVLTGDQRNFTYTPSVEMIDQTSGADTNKKYIAGAKDGSASLEALIQSGTNSVGTTQYSKLTEGNAGTLKWQPEGTAVGKPYYSAPFISQGAPMSYPYAGVVTVNVSWQQNGARTEGTN